MIHRCDFCGTEFLTEADPYVTVPTSQGYKLSCGCKLDYFKSFRELKALYFTAMERTVNPPVMYSDEYYRIKKSDEILIRDLKADREILLVLIVLLSLAIAVLAYRL